MQKAAAKAARQEIVFTISFYTRRNELSIELTAANLKEYNQGMSLYESPCGYFDGLTAKSEMYSFPSEENLRGFISDGFFTGAQKRFGSAISRQECYYKVQLAEGFRRTGTIMYRETCPECKKCIPIRIPARDFIPKKSARHLIRKNSSLELRITEKLDDFITEEKIGLYQKYWQRHNPGKTISRQNALSELASFSGCVNEFEGDAILEKKHYSGTKNFDYYLDEKLVAVSVLDFALDSISSNYFYYDISPQILKRSIGTFSIINEILWTAEHGYDYYYLGYWIEGHPKMNYKANFFPHELLVNGEWITKPSPDCKTLQ